jgi:hypothetical protein
MITTYKHNFFTGYTADMNHDTGQIIFYKVTQSGRRLFSLVARDKAHLCFQTKTDKEDWVISVPRKKPTKVSPQVLAPYIPKGKVKFIKTETKE